MYNELLEKGVIYPDSAWQQYVTDVGERLLAVSSHADETYTFTVVDEPVVNAWATPDAYIFVTRGILAYFRSEDELASVLGHEIAHVVLQHSRQQVAKIKTVWPGGNSRRFCHRLKFDYWSGAKPENYRTGQLWPKI
jgi:predicted Zn-dependent protease